jgi:hypothetical protein
LAHLPPLSWLMQLSCRDGQSIFKDFDLYTWLHILHWNVRLPTLPPLHIMGDPDVWAATSKASLSSWIHYGCFETDSPGGVVGHIYGD